MDIAYTYFSTHSRNNREAVIGMKGILRSAENSLVDPSGRLETNAVFELGAGHVSGVKGHPDES